MLQLVASVHDGVNVNCNFAENGKLYLIKQKTTIPTELTLPTMKRNRGRFLGIRRILNSLQDVNHGQNKEII